MDYDSYYERQGQMGMGQERMGMDREQMVMWQGRDMGNSLSDDISKAIIGEAHAYNFYEKLAELAPNQQYRQIILSIQRDEAKHYNWFTMILRRMGKQLPRIPQGESPEDFKEGVKASIRDELEAVAFYQDIASRATDRQIEMRFTHASRDEQRHASWFEYILMNL